ncbi:MAG TPA: hypothetical protein VKK31_26910 [Thermoanaerobaculia bacterium]|nr:hypothetical protein [Thermoanaerobaculia bacterium]
MAGKREAALPPAALASSRRQGVYYSAFERFKDFKRKFVAVQ